MPKYMTKQRKILLEFFERHIDLPITAKQIAAELSDSGISLSAVYRNLSELESEQKIRRIVSPDNREACYLYSDDKKCGGCLHLACKSCGKTMHMDEKRAEALIESVAAGEEFTIDRTDTVIYGICSDCNCKGNKKKS